MGRIQVVAATLVALGLAARALGTDQAHTLPGFKMSRPPAIDGVVDVEKEWAGAPSGSGFVDPVGGQKAPVDGKFWLAYDDKFIYFAAKMGDPDPKSIKANNYQTNVALSGDDTVSLEIDPFGNLTDWSGFTMNPKGATNVSVSGGRAAKREWLGEFVAKGRITSEGWEVEAKIPWAIMPLPGAGPRTLRIMVSRSYARTGLYYTWCYIPSGKIEQIAKWTGVDIPKVVLQRAIRLLPYGYLGAMQGGPPIADGGLDMKTDISDNLELVGSVKPDFRNIEQNILSLDFSHYARIAGESRPFFLEGGNDFDPGGTGLFLSQSIPNFDAGFKLFGKLNEKTTVGLLDADNFGTSNAFAASVQNNPDHFTQFYFTGTSLDGHGARNQTAGFAAFRTQGKFFIDGGESDTYDSLVGQGNSSNAMLGWSDRSWQISGGYQTVSPKFSPALGLAPMVDMKGPNAMCYYMGTSQHGPLSSTNAYASAFDYTHYGGGDFYRSLSFGSSAAWRNKFSVSVSASFTTFSGVDEHVYSFQLGKFEDPYRSWSVGASWGSQLGASYLLPSAGFAYKPVKNLQTSLTYQYSDFNGTSDQAILTANYDLGHERSVSTRIVKQSNSWNAFFTYCRTGNLGIEYYVIVGDPNALSFHPSLILKVVVPFNVPLK